MYNRFQLSWAGIKHATGSPGQPLLLALLAGFAIGAGALLVIGWWAVGALTLLFSGAGFAALILAGLMEYNTAIFKRKRAMLNNWAKEAVDPEEADKRFALLQLGTLDEQFAASGLQMPTSRVNIDGTLMMENALIDTAGSMYGSSSASSPVYNPLTGLYTDPGSAYTSPIEPSSPGGSFEHHH